MHLEAFDVVFLQESRCYIKEAKMWGCRFSGKAFWSFGSKHSCGVAILLRSHLNFKVLNFGFDWKGRYLVLDVQINGKDFQFINVYAPNNPGERKMFTSNSSRFSVSKKHLVLGGDFNFVENIGLDKKRKKFQVWWYWLCWNEILEQWFWSLWPI